MIPVLYEDRMAAVSLTTGVGSVLASKGLLETNENGVARVNFCGMVTDGKEVYVFLPRNSMASSTAIRPLERAAITVRALERYATRSMTSAVTIGADEGPVSMGLLPLAHEILEDYMSHGIHVRRLKLERTDRGRPHWGRTIARNLPLHAPDGTPIYPSIRTITTAVSSDNLVTLIHASIIRALGRDFSWWITGRADIDISAGLEIYAEPDLPVETQINLLQRELGLTYSEREIRLFKNLMHYLEQSAQASGGPLVIGLKNFHNCWEEMLRSTLPGVLNVNSRLPRPAYRLAGGVISQRRKGMVTDIVMRNEGTLTVADAKYYHASTPDNAPGISDMVKQFFYAIGLRHLMGASSVRNLFIFPGTGGELEQGIVVEPSTGEALDDAFPPIECVYFCPVMVMKYYTSTKKMDAEILENLTLQP